MDLPLPTDDGVKSLGKIVRILDAFSARERSLSLAEVCRRLGYPKSTTHRLLAAMRRAGLLDQDEEGGPYRLGLKLFELGSTVLANMELHREARPFVETLARLSGQAVHLAAFDGRNALVVQRAEAQPEAPLPASFIETAPVHSTGVGKAILAFQPEAAIERVIAAGLARHTEATLTDPAALRAELARIRAAGHAYDEGEHQPGLRCVAAPIHDRAGRVIAAISASGPAWRLPIGERDSIARMVRHAADGISAALGWRG
ncbi:MAG: IclR family transcriptional regulator [Rhodospirillales bacterium]|nr:IclR family transcriptional regulator [Rhodospirillales bacterium]